MRSYQVAEDNNDLLGSDEDAAAEAPQRGATRSALRVAAAAAALLGVGVLALAAGGRNGAPAAGSQAELEFHGDALDRHPFLSVLFDPRYPDVQLDAQMNSVIEALKSADKARGTQFAIQVQGFPLKEETVVSASEDPHSGTVGMIDSTTREADIDIIMVTAADRLLRGHILNPQGWVTIVDMQSFFRHIDKEPWPQTCPLAQERLACNIDYIVAQDQMPVTSEHALTSPVTRVLQRNEVVRVVEVRQSGDPNSAAAAPAAAPAGELGGAMPPKAMRRRLAAEGATAPENRTRGGDTLRRLFGDMGGQAPERRMRGRLVDGGWVTLSFLDSCTQPLEELPTSPPPQATAMRGSPTGKRRGSFLIVGDWGWDPDLHWNIKTRACQEKNNVMMMQKFVELGDVKFIVNVGDSFYPRGVGSPDDPQWQAKWRDVYHEKLLSVPWYSVYGNHDLYLDPCTCLNKPCAQVNANISDLRSFYMPDTSYAVPHPELDLEVVALDLNWLGDPGVCPHTLCPADCPRLLQERAEKAKALFYDRLASSSARNLLIFSHYPTDYFRTVPEIIKAMQNDKNHDILYAGGHRHSTDQSSTIPITPGFDFETPPPTAATTGAPVIPEPELTTSFDPDAATTHTSTTSTTTTITTTTTVTTTTTTTTLVYQLKESWVVGGGGGLSCDGPQGFLVGEILENGELHTTPVLLPPGVCC